MASVEDARAMVARLGDSVSFYKIGYQLGFAGGVTFTRELIDADKQVFVDLKLHDIGNTVAQGVKSVARLGAKFLTVHAYPQTMQAAVDAREGGLHILAVTVLTSSDDDDLVAAGYAYPVAELVARRAASCFGHPGHPAVGQRPRRAKTYRDADRGHRRRRRLSGGRPADHCRIR